MYCNECGKEINDKAVVCPNCGCKVSKTEELLPKKAPNKTSMILGIIGIVSAWIFALLGHAISIVGIVLGIKEYKSSGNITGLVLSIIGEVCAIFSSIIGATIAGSLFANF